MVVGVWGGVGVGGDIDNKGKVYSEFCLSVSTSVIKP